MISWLKRIRQAVRGRLISELGLRQAFVYWWKFRHSAGTRGLTNRIHPRHSNHPLLIRQCSSDAHVFEHVFLDLEFGPMCSLCDTSDVRLVIDCGANVGYSSAFFLSQFPCCTVVAVEPDPDNFAMLRLNLLEYGERVKLLQAGIWSHCAPLVISRGMYRDGRGWATQVRTCGANECADLNGLGIESVLNSSGFDRISLLKMDIEGAEAVVFRENLEWLDLVDAIVIELHDDSSFGNASDVFHAAVRDRGFEFLRSGELTMCFRPGKDILRSPCNATD